MATSDVLEWAMLADDVRLSEPFRLLCSRCLETLRALAIRGLI